MLSCPPSLSSQKEDRDGGGLSPKSLAIAGKDVIIEKENRGNTIDLLAGACVFT